MGKTINEQIIKASEKLIIYGLPILYFLISIAFYLKTYDSAQIKITLIQIGGTVLIASWLIKVIEEESWGFFKNNSIIIVPLLLFLISGIISALRSPFPYASTNELIRRIMYIGMALIVVKEFNSEERFNTLFGWLFFAAFVATIYGLIQRLDHLYFPPNPEPGLDPFIWRGAFGSRIFSTFGNPNFYGDFLVVMSPITLAMLARSRKFDLLVLWGLILINVYWTASKGAWLGFAAGLWVFVFLYIGYFLHTNKQKIKKILIGMIIATTIFFGIALVKNLSGRPDSASFRIFTWLSTWEMIKTKPWLGTGIGTFYVTYPAWRRPQIFVIEGRHNTETDHPENEYLEVWYDEGYVGFGIFLWLLVGIVLISFQNLKIFSETGEGRKSRDIRAYYELGLLSALLAQLVHNLVCVSLRFVSSGIFLWLLVGLIGALNVHNPFKNNEGNELIKKSNPSTTRLYLKRVFQLVILVCAVFCMKIFYGFFDADINHNIAIFYSKQAQWKSALDHYDRVVTQNPSFIMAHYFMGNVYNDRWGEGDPARAIDKYKDVWSLAPNYVQSHHQAGLIYLKWGEREKQREEDAKKRNDLVAAQQHRNKKIEIWRRALSEFEKYRTIDPIFPLNYYRIAWIYMQLNDRKKAEETYLAHVNSFEKLKERPHNAWVEDWGGRRKHQVSETYMNLGNLRFLKNDLSKAEEYYKKAVDLKPDSVNALKNLAVMYSRQNKFKQAGEIWQKLRKIAPEDPDVKKVFQRK